MKLHKLLFGVFLFVPGFMNAQTDFRPGYIIKNSGDTVYGKIDYRRDQLMSSLCKFKDSDQKITEFSPDDILAYRFINSKFYVTKEINDKKVFMEYLIKGKINVFYLRDEQGENYFLSKDSAQLTRIPYDEGIKEIDGIKVFYRTQKHIGILNYYMQDAPQLQPRIQSMKKPEYENMIKLAEDYHNAVCKGEKCIIYEKKVPFIKVNPEVTAGVVTFKNNDEDLINRSYFQCGMIAHFWMPGMNENFYFKTGFIYSQAEKVNGEKTGYLKIPTHIEYMAPITYRIRPSVSIGLMSPSYSCGLEIRIYNRVHIGIQSWVNFYSDNEICPLLPSGLCNYSILGSFYVNL
jgi:hypothetical protein